MQLTLIKVRAHGLGVGETFVSAFDSTGVRHSVTVTENQWDAVKEQTVIIGLSQGVIPYTGMFPYGTMVELVELYDVVVVP